MGWGRKKRVDPAALDELMQNADISNDAQDRMRAANERPDDDASSAPVRGHGAPSPSFQSVMDL